MMNKFFRLKIHFIEAERDGGFGGGDFGGVSSASDVGGAGGAGVGGGGFGGDRGDSEGTQFGGTLTADLGGGLTAQVDPGTGRTVSFAGGAPQESPEALQLKTKALKAGRSVFGQRLADLFGSGKFLGALGGLAVGLLTPFPIAAAIKGGAAIGEKVSPSGSIFDSPQQKGAGAPQQVGLARQQEIQQAQQQAGLTQPSAPAATSPLSIGLGGGIDGGEDRAAQAVQIAAAGRQSGLQPQLGQQQPFRPPQQRFLNTGGALPTVNIGAFPGALGRV